MSEKTENPYLSAQRVWNERYGEYVMAAHNWKMIAFFGLGMAFIGMTGAIYIGSQSKLVPYVIQTDPRGNILSAGVPRPSRPDDNVLESQLRDWVTAHRSVVSDPDVQNGYLQRTYAFLMDGMPAKAAVDDFYTKEGKNPFERLKEGTIKVEVESTLRQSETSYQIDWIEKATDPSGKPIRLYDPSGREVEGQRYRGIFSVEYHKVDEATLQLNPLGLFFKTISIQRLGG